MNKTKKLNTKEHAVFLLAYLLACMVARSLRGLLAARACMLALLVVLHAVWLVGLLACLLLTLPRCACLRGCLCQMIRKVSQAANALLTTLAAFTS